MFRIYRRKCSGHGQNYSFLQSTKRCPCQIDIFRLSWPRRGRRMESGFELGQVSGSHILKLLFRFRANFIPWIREKLYVLIVRMACKVSDLISHTLSGPWLLRFLDRNLELRVKERLTVRTTLLGRGDAAYATLDRRGTSEGLPTFVGSDKSRSSTTHR